MRLSSQVELVRRFVFEHPLGRRRRLAAFVDYLCWQVGSRLVPGPVAVELTDRARLLAQPRLDGALGNVFGGLAEFEDMAFTVHMLRPGDLLVDVGANVGAFTILGAVAAGARVVAFEPVEEARGWLVRNVGLNLCGERVEVRAAAAGARLGKARMTVGRDAFNRVLRDGEAAPDRVAEVPVETLDLVLGARVPTMVKIDVEGFEIEVLEGATRTLGADGLRAVLVEMDGRGTAYSVKDLEVDRILRAAGFAPAAYEPFTRVLAPIGLEERTIGANALFVRGLAGLRDRLRAAEPFRAKGIAI